MHFLSREIVTVTAVVSAVANPSPTPALIALNILLKLKKFIACVNAQILTPLVFLHRTPASSFSFYTNCSNNKSKGIFIFLLLLLFFFVSNSDPGELCGSCSKNDEI